MAQVGVGEKKNTRTHLFIRRFWVIGIVYIENHVKETHTHIPIFRRLCVVRSAPCCDSSRDGRVKVTSIHYEKHNNVRHPIHRAPRFTCIPSAICRPYIKISFMDG